ncbi:MAG: TIGR04282 family arsenosugar biosynthesis glycosyltransferase [Chitinophagales bacterium]
MQILHIFIKNPVLGQVKTRLAATLGAEEALRIYFFLLEKTREVSLSTNARRWLWYSGIPSANDGWEEADFVKKQQVEGDLGARMSAALGAAFQEGAEKAILIGSDCPSLRAELLEQAFSALDQSEVVLGPTYDGGYYLIGMRRWLPQLFDGIAWSTETVLSATLKQVEVLGVTCSLLDQLRDIDEEADWRAFLETQDRFSVED